MRRFLAVFLLAFVPPMAVVVWFATPPLRARARGDERPLVGTDTTGLPPKGEHLAENVRIHVYEGDHQLAEVVGASARFEGREVAEFTGTQISAWPEKGRHEAAPEEVHLSADFASVDQKSRTARLRGRVHVQTPGGDRLEAEDLNVDFGGRTLETAGPVELVHGESRLRGTGFTGSLALKTFRFEKDVEGSFFGTRADWSPTTTPRPGALPEDVTFSAGGPVTGEPIEETAMLRRTRVQMEGGVSLLRIEGATEKPTRIECRTLSLELRRQAPVLPASVVVWRATLPLRRAAGSDAEPPEDVRAAELAARPTLALERMDAAGDVRIADPRAEIEADRVSTLNRPDGGGTTVVHGHRKRIVFRDRAALTLGPLGEVKSASPAGPLEITCVDDVTLERRANAPSGAPAGATATLRRWVSVRDGARELTADDLTIELMPRNGSESSALGFAPRSIEANGNVLVVEAGRSARADRLRWDVGSDTLRLYGTPAAEVVDPGLRLRAARIFFDHRRSLVIADGDVVASGERGLGDANFLRLSPRASASSGRWELRCRHLEAKSENGAVAWLEAGGSPVITSDDAVIHADAVRFEGGFAHLSGRPVRVESGKDFVEARNVTVDTEAKTASLFGVQRLLFHAQGGMQALVGIGGLEKTAPDAGTETPITLTCRGPVYVDQASGLLHARDAVAVRTDEARLDCERLELGFNPDTHKLEGARAGGRVFLRTPETAAAGERLVYDVPAATVSLAGPGKVSVWREGTWLRVDEILIADGGKSVTFLARYSKGSVSFPDKERSGKSATDWMKKGPFGDLQPEGEKK